MVLLLKRFEPKYLHSVTVGELLINLDRHING